MAGSKMAGSNRPRPAGGKRKHPSANGKQHSKKHKQAPATVTPNVVDVPTDEDDDAQMLEEEDVAFVQQYGRRLGFLADLNAAALTPTMKPKKDGAAQQQTGHHAHTAGDGDSHSDDDDDGGGMEAGYEAHPRGLLEEQAPKVTPLPIKAPDGRITNPLEGKPPRRSTALLPAVPGIHIHDPHAAALGGKNLAGKSEMKAGGSETKQKRGKREGKTGGVDGEEEEDDDEEDEDEDDGFGGDAAKMTKQQRRAARKKAARDAKRAATGDGSRGDDVQGHGDVQGRGGVQFPSKAARQEAAKVQIAAAAQKLLVHPEQNVKQLRVLNALLGDADPMVCRLALLSAAAVYKDILPGYKIRLPTEKELAMPVSKEVKVLRDYESALLKGYQTYLKHLLKAATSSTTHEARAALRCMCLLLDTHPSFNYASDLLQLIVTNTVHKDVGVATMCCDAVEQLLGSDVLGQLSLEAVQLVADVIKRRNCVACRPRVLMCLYALQIDALQEPVGMGGSSRDKQHGKNKGKKKHKGNKKGDEVDDAFKQAAAAPDREERQRLQSKTLEALFEALFRVIKHAANSAALTVTHAGPLQPSAFTSKFPLLRVALEGLTKYAHVIDVDYFESLLTVLTSLVNAPRLPPTEKLCVLLAASQLLRGQGQSLTLDQQQLYRSLYRMLDDIILVFQETDIPPGVDTDDTHTASHHDTHNDTQTTRHSHPQQHPPPQHAQHATTTTTTTTCMDTTTNVAHAAAVLLSGMLLDRKSLDSARMVAFAKAVARSGVLVTESGMAAGCLSVLHRMLRRYSTLQGLLEDPASGPLATSGPLWTAGDEEGTPLSATARAAAASPLWELSLLQQHYHPHVAAAGRVLAGGGSGGGGQGGGKSHGGSQCALLSSYHTPEDAAAAYDTTRGRFRPPPAVPKTPKGGGGVGKHQDEAAVVQRLMALDENNNNREQGGNVEEDLLENEFGWHFRMTRLHAEHEQLRRELLVMQTKLAHAAQRH